MFLTSLSRRQALSSIKILETRMRQTQQHGAWAQDGAIQLPHEDLFKLHASTGWTTINVTAAAIARNHNWPVIPSVSHSWSNRHVSSQWVGGGRVGGHQYISIGRQRPHLNLHKQLHYSPITFLTHVILVVYILQWVKPTFQKKKKSPQLSSGSMWTSSSCFLSHTDVEQSNVNSFFMCLKKLQGVIYKEGAFNEPWAPTKIFSNRSKLLNLTLISTYQLMRPLCGERGSRAGISCLGQIPTKVCYNLLLMVLVPKPTKPSRSLPWACNSMHHQEDSLSNPLTWPNTTKWLS